MFKKKVHGLPWLTGLLLGFWSCGLFSGSFLALWAFFGPTHVGQDQALGQIDGSSYLQIDDNLM